MPQQAKTLVNTPDLFDKFLTLPSFHQLDVEGIWPYWKVFEPPQPGDPHTIVRFQGSPILMFGSNDYLALTRDQRVIEAATEAARQYGTGFGGSRYLNGSSVLHRQLEEELADFFNVESTLLFGTGYQTNVGVLSTLAGREDAIVADRRNHACLIDGALLSGARVIRFQHNNLTHLETCLLQCADDQPRIIVVEGVYSLEGDLAPLTEIVQLAKRYQARLFVDDAHGIGVLGENGRGTAQLFGCASDIDVLTCTFSKSFASSGGFVGGSKDLIAYLKRTARQFIYSASVTPPIVATALAALRIMRSEPNRSKKIRETADYCRNLLRQEGFSVQTGKAAIVSVPFSDGLGVCNFVNRLLEHGMYVNPVISTGSSENMIRISVTAAHERDDVERLVFTMKQVAAEIQLPPFTGSPAPGPE